MLVIWEEKQRDPGDSQSAKKKKAREPNGLNIYDENTKISEPEGGSWMETDLEVTYGTSKEAMDGWNETRRN